MAHTIKEEPQTPKWKVEVNEEKGTKRWMVIVCGKLDMTDGFGPIFVLNLEFAFAL